MDLDGMPGKKLLEDLPLMAKDIKESELTDEQLCKFAEYCRRNMSCTFSELTYDGRIRTVIIPELIKRIMVYVEAS